jgi:low temperature requirement protein LtrA
LAVPAWAERAGATPWHPHHIAERHGLLTIIVLGESILAATVAIEAAWSSGETLTALAPVIGGGLLTVFSMWWIYFDRPVHDLLSSRTRAFVWGYGHYFIFLSAAAVGAGLAAAVDAATAHAAIGTTGAGLAVAIPVSIYLTALWILHDRPNYQPTWWLVPVAVPLILAAPFTAYGIPAIGAILAGIVAIKTIRGPLTPRPSPPPSTAARPAPRRRAPGATAS